MPWDIAAPGRNPNPQARTVLHHAQLCLSAWLQAAKNAHVNPDVTFAPDNNYLARVSGQYRIVAPDVRAYKAAMIAFRNMYVTCADTGNQCSGAPVRIVSAWNEPNARNGSSRVGIRHLRNFLYTPNGRRLMSDAGCPPGPRTSNCGPMLAGQMWNIAYRRLVESPGVTITPRVTVVAGEFAGGGGLGRGGSPYGGYLQKYNAYLGNLTAKRPYYPGVWGLHDYVDIMRFEAAHHAHRKAPAPSAVRNFSRALNTLAPAHYKAKKTRIWLDEVSVFRQHGLNIKGKPNGWGTSAQTAAARYLLANMPVGERPGDPQVGRFYYLRYFDTVDWRALVVGTKSNGNDVDTKGIPAYGAFAHRHKIKR